MITLRERIGGGSVFDDLEMLVAESTNTEPDGPKPTIMDVKRVQ